MGRLFPFGTVGKAWASGSKRGSRFPVAPAIERTLDGIVFASKREMERYAHLKLRLRIGEISDLERQPSWKVEIGGKPYCKYSADFRYRDERLGRIVIEEVKSGGTARDAAYRLRRLAAELAHGIIVTEVLA